MQDGDCENKFLAKETGKWLVEVTNLTYRGGEPIYRDLDLNYLYHEECPAEYKFENLRITCGSRIYASKKLQEGETFAVAGTLSKPNSISLLGFVVCPESSELRYTELPVTDITGLVKRGEVEPQFIEICTSWWNEEEVIEAEEYEKQKKKEAEERKKKTVQKRKATLKKNNLKKLKGSGSREEVHASSIAPSMLMDILEMHRANLEKQAEANRTFFEALLIQQQEAIDKVFEHFKEFLKENAEGRQSERRHVENIMMNMSGRRESWSSPQM